MFHGALHDLVQEFWRVGYIAILLYVLLLYFFKKIERGLCGLVNSFPMVVLLVTCCSVGF